MKYFYDTEFIEGTQDCYSWLGLKVDTWLRILAILFALIAGIILLLFDRNILTITFVVLNYTTSVFLISLSMPKTPPTIDLISIGVVSEDGREFYAISKDFNLKEAWNRYDLKQNKSLPNTKDLKIYWIRENVLKTIWQELYVKDQGSKFGNVNNLLGWLEREENPNESDLFTYKSLKKLIEKYGMTNEEIRNELYYFCTGEVLKKVKEYNIKVPEIELYGYYSDYDHVVLCWLFGKMIELPNGFPMVTIDVQQELIYKAEKLSINFCYSSGNHTVWNTKEAIEYIKKNPQFPKSNNDHSAIVDARFIRRLHHYLKNN